MKELPDKAFKLLILLMHFKIYIAVKLTSVSPVFKYCLMFAEYSVDIKM